MPSLLYLGVFVFAVSGAIAGRPKDMDLLVNIPVTTLITASLRIIAIRSNVHLPNRLP